MRTEKLCFKVFSACTACIMAMVISSCIIYMNKGEKVIFEEGEEEAESLPKEDKGGEYFLILNEKTGEVEKISAYSYALGAVMAEMPPNYHQEALKAQSLSALTRARYLKRKYEKGEGNFENCHFSQNPDENEGFVREENAQLLYRENTEAYMDKMRKAADFAVSHEIVYEGEPILAAYHAMSPGFTEDCEAVWGKKLPYLVKRESPGDSLNEKYEVTEKMPFQKVKILLNKAYPAGSFPDGEEKSWIEPQSFSKGGFVRLCRAGGVETEGKDVRKALSLRSAAFNLEVRDGFFYITTRGYGHGVGLSQVGSDFMGRQGKTAEEIIEHYYKGAEVNLV